MTPNWIENIRAMSRGLVETLTVVAMDLEDLNKLIDPNRKPFELRVV